jgi:hypothetical protein
MPVSLDFVEDLADVTRGLYTDTEDRLLLAPAPWFSTAARPTRMGLQRRQPRRLVPCCFHVTIGDF